MTNTERIHIRFPPDLLAEAKAAAKAEGRTLSGWVRRVIEVALGKQDHAQATMVDALRSIADFAVGNGDVCEIIARRARAVLRAVEEGGTDGRENDS